MSLAAVMGRAVQKTVMVFLPEFLFFNLRWHWRSLGSKTFMGEARVCPVCGAGFPPPQCQLRLSISILPQKKQKQPLRDLIRHCSKQHLASHGAAPKRVPGKKENQNGPHSMWNSKMPITLLLKNRGLWRCSVIASARTWGGRWREKEGVKHIEADEKRETVHHIRE